MPPPVLPSRLRRLTRQCTICRRTGHNRARCTEAPASLSVIDTLQSEEIFFDPPEPVVQESEEKKQVIVQVTPHAVSSPHIIDLQDGTRSDAYRTMPVYETATKKAPLRTTIDFASAVRQANARAPHLRLATVQRPLAAISAPARPVTRSVQVPVSVQKEKISTRLQDMRAAWTAFFARKARLWFSRRTAMGAVAMLLLVAIPFPTIGYYRNLKQTSASIVSQGTHGLFALQASTVAAFSADFPKATEDLTTALQSLSAANTLLSEKHDTLLSIASLLPIVGNQVQSRQHVLAAGEHLALGNTYLVKGIQDAKQTADLSFTSRLAMLREHIRGAEPQYEQALQELSAIDIKTIPAEYQQSFGDFKVLFGTFVNDMNDLNHLIETLELVLGSETLKRYLVVFQNQHELRPTGGFMGSFAIVDFQKGKLVNVEVPGGGTYDVRGQLPEYVKPPLPLQLVNGRWEFQDANWFPDFSASAQKIAWFFDHARGTTVDGVIAVNASVLERLVGVLGTVTDEEYAITLTPGSAITTLQDVVETAGAEKNTQPKAAVGALFEEVLTRMSTVSQGDLVRLLSAFHEAAEEKEIQVYANDEKVQQELRRFGWTGEVLPVDTTKSDYLMVVFANVQGQKTDAKITQTVSHEVTVAEDGSVVDTVRIRRDHAGTPGERFYGGKNIGYVRVYVPRGATLMDAGGFTFPPEEAFHPPEEWYVDDPHLADIEQGEHMDVKTGTRVTTEFDKTAFGNWMVVGPGESSEVFFTYRLPFRVFTAAAIAGVTQTERPWYEKLLVKQPPITAPYRIVVQKQSGVAGVFKQTVTYPEAWAPVWRSHEAMDFNKHGTNLSVPLTGDEVIGMLMEYTPDV